MARSANRSEGNSADTQPTETVVDASSVSGIDHSRAPASSNARLASEKEASRRKPLRVRPPFATIATDVRGAMYPCSATDVPTTTGSNRPGDA